MRILVADDESLARSRLCSLIEELQDYQVCGEAASGEETVSLCEQEKPDVVLLDIRMPGMDGLQAARYLAELEPPPAVIFTTAYDEYALKAFETHAVDYLVKPIRQQRLAESLKRVQTLTQGQLSALADMSQDGQRRHVSVNDRGNLQLIAIEDIIYFQAEQKYTTVCHLQGKALIEEPLKSLEKDFADRFLRIHRNALVALEYIEGLDKRSDGRVNIRLRNTPDTLEVSRRHLAEVRRRLKAMAR